MSPLLIALVTDDPAQFATVADLLRATFDRPLELCPPAASALPWIARNQPKLLLIDAGPAGSRGGVGLARLLRNQRSVPTVLLTTAANDDATAQATRSDELVRVQLPCQPAHLRTIVDALLREHRLLHRLQQSEAKLSHLSRAVEQSPASIVITDKSGKIEYVNPHFERVTGYTAAEAIGLNPRLLKSGAQPPAFYLDLWQTLTRGQTWSGEFHNRRKDGSLFWEKASISPLRGPTGIVTHYIAVKEDITAQRAAHEELVHALAAAETASRAKSTFLAAMSHELRTPLNVINGVTATLLEQSPAPPQRQGLELALQSGQHLLSIIEEILDYSAFQAGKIQPDPAPFDLPALVHQLIRQVVALPAARHLRVGLHLAPDVPRHVVGDARRLRQVLLNLLSNAIKFTPAGTVRLRVRRQLGPAASPGVHFSVLDTGIGLAPDQRERIFQPFTQADESITRRFGGTGLGLTLSRSYVELLGGRLLLRSRLGVGSIFAFSVPLPLAEAASVSAPASAPATPGQLGRQLPLSVLAADDIATNRQVIGVMLRHLGYPTTLVENGAEAIAALRLRRYDLVLLDLQMPVMDGLTAAAEIRRTFAAAPDRPRLVAVTANVRPDDRAACRAAGFDDFLPKPVLPAQLAACIQRLFTAGAPGQPPLAPPPFPDAVTWIDVPHLQALTAGLPPDRAAAFLAPLQASAAADFATVLSHVRAACADHNAMALADALHGLKGCFQTLGWMHAAAVCTTALAAARASRFADWDVFPDELVSLHRHSDAAMTRFLGELCAAHPTPAR